MGSIESISFCHLTDSHFDSEAFDAGRSISLYRRNLKIFEAIKAIPDLDFVAHGGDLIHRTRDDDVAEMYEHFDSELLADLDTDFFPVPGNHDHLGLLRDSIRTGSYSDLHLENDRICYTVRRGPIRFLFLDTRNGMEDSGFVAPAQIEWLLGQLESLADSEYAFLFMHHPLFFELSEHVQGKLVVSNGEEVHQLLKEHASKILHVYHGHLHDACEYKRDGVSYTSAPPASFGVVNLGSREEPRFAVDPTAPVGFHEIRISNIGASPSMYMRPHFVDMSDCDHLSEK